MTDFKDVMSLKPKQWVAGVTICMGSLTPGILILFWFKQSFFISLELGKLILLAISITMPIVVLNIFVALPHMLSHGDFNDNAPDNELINPVDLFVEACGFTGLALYVSLGISYFSSFNFKEFCIAVASIELFLLLWKWISFLKNVKRS